MSESASMSLISPTGRWQLLIPFIKPYGWQITAALLALLFTAMITLSIGQGLRLLIDSGFAAQRSEAFDQAIVLFIIMAVLLAVGTFIRFFLVSWIGERVVADIRQAVFEHIIELHPAYFETTAAAEVQSRITTDTTLLQTVIGSSVSIALRNALMFLGGLVWMFISNPKLTLLVLLVVPLVVFPILYFGRKVRSLSRSSQDRIADVGTYMAEVLHNVKIVQAFNHQAVDKQAFGRYVDSAFQIAVQRITQRAWMSTVVIVMVLGALAVLIWVGGHDVMAGVITAGELAAFMFYAVMVASSVAMISEVIGELQRAAGATERLMDLYQADNLITAPVSAATLPERVQGVLSIHELSFAYPSRPDVKALDGISLSLQPGTSLALVGASGAGKSTLFDLLLRFYDPLEGCISLDGVPIHTLAPETLRQHIGLVPQQPVLFTGSIAENIRYGRPDASDEELVQAAKAAFADEFIQRLPGKYETEIGERGVRLSGGQRQRIAIARAILKNPCILLLDEATSALDADSEFQVQQALQHIMRQRTSLVIAHRLATVVNADHIVVLEQGQIVAQGKHHELLKSSALYARWAQLQFENTGD